MPNVFTKLSASFGQVSGKSLQGIREFENEEASEVVHRPSQIFIKTQEEVETLPKLNASKKRKARDFY